jgi:ppGpp synthetase/RelA/SpoT-type nucleotidyltranferase
VRTLIVVKYLDGVQFLADKLKSFCARRNIACESFLEARDVGYYAGHVYVKQPFEIPRMNWDTEVVQFPVEIQVTTQLQEAVRALLHKYYEDRRGRPKVSGERWQWDYKSDEFAANYIGHTLHFVEGMIVEIREKQKRGMG